MSIHIRPFRLVRFLYHEQTTYKMHTWDTLDSWRFYHVHKTRVR